MHALEVPIQVALIAKAGKSCSLRKGVSPQQKPARLFEPRLQNVRMRRHSDMLVKGVDEMALAAVSQP